MFPKRLIACVCVCVALGCLMSGTAPIDGTFNYQGRLTNSGAAITGTADLKFRLYDDSAAGAQVGSEIELLAVSVQAGLFEVDLDFGVASFNGDQRWLEIDARSPAGVGGYTTLSPRQQILATPYSIQTRGIVVDEDNRVGIGTNTPLNPLHVESDGVAAIVGRNHSNHSGARGVYGHASATTGPTSGVYGYSVSTTGYGVSGHADASTGTTHGVSGSSRSTSGRGVSGNATASTGQTYGVHGESRSWSGYGVSGEATATSGSTFGVYGRSESTSGYGVFGDAPATSGATYGVYGRSASTTGIAVYGKTSTTTGINYGGWFESRSTSGHGVFGYATANSGITYGGRFETDSTVGRGVFGLARANSGVNFGVVGHSNSSSGYDFWASGAGTNYGSNSSRRWKNNIINIDSPLDKLAQLRGVYFDWDAEHGGHHDVGMIAEEVGAILPEIVNYEENGVDAIGMDYSKMTPLLVEAVNALRAEKDAENDALRAENRAIRDDNNQLRARLESLENRLDAMASPQKENH